ncbi:hypothetical protein DL765_011752 [Monosporascus sp. GIB2]|nr:hypothetical protein DL765_011752 [Monosporascus sp. GIB2]
MQHGDQKSMTVQGHNIEDDLPELPTRVIDVGVEGLREPRLLISSGARANYVTLSYCWGKTRPITTQTLTLQQHLDSIPFSELPKTFQDAVTVTRALGYQFLWIDSLCIIQDSAEDWQQECAKMATIYMRAIVTIAGTKVTDSQSGFLAERQAAPLTPHIWEYKSTEEAKSQRAVLRHHPVTYPSSVRYHFGPELVDIEADSPLQTRGWILQEFTLSPRLLLFGPFRMRLECQTCTYFEDYENEEFTHMDSGRNLKQDIQSKISSNQRARAWYDILFEYTRRDLSNSNDMLPAVAGMARWLIGDSGKNDNYVAGLLKDDLCNGLAWYVVTSPAKPPASEYRSPSWSWASTDNQVGFVVLDRPEAEETTDYVAGSNDYGSFSGKSKRSSRNTRVVIHRIELELKGVDRFGQVKFASLKLQGRVKIGWIDISEEKNHGGIPSWHVYLTNSNNKVGLFWADDSPYWKSLYETATADGEVGEVPPETQNTWRRPIKFLYLDTNENGDFNAVGIKPVESDASPLATLKTGSDNLYKHYQRVGIFFNHEMPYPYSPHWFEDADWKLIELL